MSDFRALDADGDWTWGNGVENYVVEQAAIVLDIQTALQTFLGEVFFALDFGVDWWNLLGGRDENQVILQCRKIISGCDGVTRINSVTARLDSRARQLMVTFNINTVYSRNTTAIIAVP